MVRTMDTAISSIFEHGFIFSLMKTMQSMKYTLQQLHLCLDIAYFSTILTVANKTFSGQVTRQKKQK